MLTLLWAERQKLRRSNIIWIAIFATAMVSLIVFLAGRDSSYQTVYLDNAGWYMSMVQIWATILVLPANISLLGSYLICREEQDDTMKSLRIIPVNEAKLTIAKMTITFVFSILMYLLVFFITLLVEAILHCYALSAEMVFSYLKAYLLDGFCVFLAISPIIACVSFRKKGYWLALVITEMYSMVGLFTSMSNVTKALYPISAVFTISGYYEATAKQIVLSCISLAFCAGFAILILFLMNKRRMTEK